MPGSVVSQTPVRSASAAAALIEEHDAILFGVEKATHPGFRTTAWATVQKYYWLALGIAALFEIDAMIGVYAKVSGAVGFDGRVEGIRFDCHTSVSKAQAPT